MTGRRCSVRLVRSRAKGSGRNLCLFLIPILMALGAWWLKEAIGQGRAAGSQETAEQLYTRYRTVVERNVFSRSARSPRPQPQVEVKPEEARRAPVAEDPGARLILTGVVMGGPVPLALVEDSRTRETRVYQLGGDTPAGRLEVIDADAVLFSQGTERRRIQVGYTLNGERSAKLASAVTSVGERALAPSESPPSPGQARAATAEGGPPARLRRGGARWQEVMRRMRERSASERGSVDTGEGDADVEDSEEQSAE